MLCQIDNPATANVNEAWFRVGGQYRLAMFSCADLRNGEFRKTVAEFAEPLDAAIENSPA